MKVFKEVIEHITIHYDALYADPPKLFLETGMNQTMEN